MAVGVNIISTFNSAGINKAIADFGRLKTSGQKAAFGLQTVNAGFAKLAKVGAITGGIIAAIGFKLAQAGETAEASDRRIQSIAKSMGIFGNEAGVVASRLIKLADAQALLTGIDDSAIKLTQAKLLTFKELAITADQVGGNFDRATMAAMDLAAAGFGEVSMNAAQLGKAMNDPIKGITALRRAGVTFTEAEREKIKVLIESGKMLEAQGVVLAAIETQVGGTAKATATATDKMRVGFSEMAEDIGSLLVPVINSLAVFINGTLVPYIKNLVAVIGTDGLGAALQIVGKDLLNFTTHMGAVGNTILAVTTLFLAVKAATIAYTTTVAILSVVLPLLRTSLVGATVAQTQLNVAMLSNPIGLIVAGIALLVVALVALYLKFEFVRTVLNSIFNFLIGMFEKWVNAWISAINIIIKGINFLIRAANFFGADINEIGYIGEVAFGRIGDAASGAVAPLGEITEQLRQFRIQEHQLGNTTVKTLSALTSVALATRDIATSQAEVNELRKLAMAGEMIDPEELSDALDALSKAEKVLKDIKGTGAGGGAGKNIDTATDKLKKYIDALKSSTAAERSLRDSARSLADARAAQIASVQKVKDAQEKFNNVTRGYSAASKEAKDATDKMTSANKKLRDANISQQDAIRGVTEAEKKLQALRDIKANPVDVAEAERSLEKSKYAVEQSVFSVADAEQELADLRADPLSSPTEIRRAEISLAEAKLGVTEAAIAQTDAEAKLTAERDKAATPEEIADAERDLETAKLRVVDAIDDTTEATAYQLIAQAYLNEILNGAKEGSDAYRDALKELQDAQQEEVDAIDAVTVAVRNQADAIDALREAEQKLQAVRGAVGKKIVQRGNAAVASSLATASALPPVIPVASIATQIDDIFKGMTFNWGGLMMAGGGIVNKPTLAMIGEKGSEAVIPLDRMNGMGGTTVLLTVNAGMGVDGAAVGDQIVNALARWNRRNGNLPLKVM